MIKPLLLDVYCCQGGASAGYVAAGFDVIGIDLNPQPRYPYQFHQADALAALRLVADAGGRWQGRKVNAIHNSPPCQRRTRAQKIQGREHPALIAPTRELLEEIGAPWVIENVPADGPDDDPLKSPIMLCGTMFELHTYRHRLFESNVPLPAPEHARHTQPQVKMGRPVREGEMYQAVGNFSNVEYARKDMDVPWMNRDGIRECIPPAYAQYVGAALLAAL